VNKSDDAVTMPVDKLTLTLRF